MERFTNFFNNKLSNFFPVGGGSIGAVAQANNVDFVQYFPQWEAVISTIIIAALGAVIGYMVKLIFDLIFRDFKKDHHI